VKFWVSWYNTEPLEQFELHSPWWISGSRSSDGAETICAAITAATESDAKETVLASYDNRPEHIEWRFCEARPVEWSPFGDRFPRAAWMDWTD
jgi:hypothetical protein